MKYLLSISFFAISLVLIQAQDKKTMSFDVKDSTARGVIYGTLLFPTSKNAVPLVLFVAGSGPTDGDGNNAVGIKTNCTWLMAEALAENNIASLRFDKRGIAKSKKAAINESDLRFEDYVQDVIDWIAFFKDDKRVAKIILVGHSEGSLVAMLAAQKTEVAGFISLAGAGRAIDVIINEQVNKNPANSDLIKKEVINIFILLKEGKTVDVVPPYLLSLFRPSVQPYMISWLKYDPALEIKKLQCPVMILQGDTDIQVALTDAEALRRAKPEARYEIISGMNHILKDAPFERDANLITYYNPDLPLSEKLIPVIASFIDTIK